MVGTEHLLLGLTQNPECKAMQVLATLGVTSAQIKRQTARVIAESHQDEDIHTAPPPELAQAAEQKQGYPLEPISQEGNRQDTTG